MSSRHPAVDAILAVLPMSEDGTGHVADCGFDEADTCGCLSLPTRLDAIVRDHVEAALNAAADEITRGYDAGCTCEVCETAAICARIVRAAASNTT